MQIRKVDKIKDYNSIWGIFREVISTEDTNVFDSNTAFESLQKHWFANYIDTFVIEENNCITDTFIIKPSQLDLGNQITNFSYMVHPKHQGKGIDEKLCKHSLKIAKEKGYLAMQSNIVVICNTPTVKIMAKYGFKIIGTTPKAFRHKKLGFVDAYIMYQNLE